MHTSQTSRGLDAGDMFLSRKIPKTILQAACLSPALIRTDKVLEEYTHSAGMSVCTGHERHLVALTDVCRKQHSNCFIVMEHQPSHPSTPARDVAQV